MSAEGRVRSPLRCRLLGHSWRGSPNTTEHPGWYFHCRRCPTWEVIGPGIGAAVVTTRGTG